VAWKSPALGHTRVTQALVDYANDRQYDAGFLDDVGDVADAKSLARWDGSRGAYAVLSAPATSAGSTLLRFNTLGTHGDGPFAGIAPPITTCDSPGRGALAWHVPAGQSSPDTVVCARTTGGALQVEYHHDLNPVGQTFALLDQRFGATLPTLAMTDKVVNSPTGDVHEVAVEATGIVTDNGERRIVEIGADAEGLGFIRRGSGVYVGGALTSGSYAITPVDLGRLTVRVRLDPPADAPECQTATVNGKAGHQLCDTIDFNGRPVALLAAPPEVPGLGQAFVPPTFVTGRSFGTSTTKTMSADLSVGIGAELDIGGVVGGGGSNTVSVHGEYSKETSFEESVSDLYFGAAHQNTVIFHNDSSWVARYRIESSTDGLAVGSHINTYLPKRSVVTSLSQPQYQARFPNKISDAAFDALLPRSGDMSSYPNIEGGQHPNPDGRCLTGGDNPKPLGGAQHVVQMAGGDAGADATSIRIGESESTTTAWDVGIEFDRYVKAGATVSYSVGFGYGEEQTTTAGNETGADGYVSQIPYTQEELGANESYAWQMYYCKASLDGYPVWLNSFMVGDYAGRGRYYPVSVAATSPSGNEDVTVAPTLSWTATGTLKDQTVELEAVGEAGSQLITVPATAGADPTVDTTYSTIPAQLKSGTTYRWRVTGNDYLGSDTGPTEWQYFMAWGTPGAPTVYTPLANRDRSVDVEWTPGTNSVGAVYDVTVARDIAFTDVVASTTGVEGTRWRTPALSHGSYWVKVVARNPLFSGAPSTSVGVTLSPVIPVARFDLSPQQTDRRTTVSFFDESFDPDGTVVSRQWDFGDGATSTDQNPTHRYTSLGAKTVTLTVTDDDGATATATRPVLVLNLDPTAGFTVATAPGSPTNHPVSVTGTATDLDGAVTQTLWEWGDGTQTVGDVGDDTHGGGATHSYSDDGVYEIRMTVADNDGGTAAATRLVTVHNQAPTASFTHSPEQPTDLDHVAFTSTAADSDGHVASWQWDFGDGQSSLQPDPTHRFTQDGTYTVTLAVTDDDGAVTRVTEAITVANVPPVASFSWSNTTPSMLLPVQFTNGSYDPDGRIVSYAWNFGDGGSSGEASPRHTFQRCGRYTVTLTVTDDDSATASATRVIKVSATPVKYTSAPLVCKN
jgi:PKD repeat protein